MDGKLTELNRDPSVVQVEVHEGKDDKVMVCLCDSDGTFVRADCLPARVGSNMVEKTEANKEGQETDSSANDSPTHLPPSIPIREKLELFFKKRCIFDAPPSHPKLAPQEAKDFNYLKFNRPNIPKTHPAKQVTQTLQNTPLA